MAAATAAEAEAVAAAITELAASSDKAKLSMKNLGDSGAAALAPAIASNTTVTQLDLSCNSIATSGSVALAGALSANAVLRALDLSANAVGDDGAVALAGAIAKNTMGVVRNILSAHTPACTCSTELHGSLRQTALDLHANSIGDKGAVALAEALGSNTTLKVLDLRANYIADVGAQALIKACRETKVSRGQPAAAFIMMSRAG